MMRKTSKRLTMFIESARPTNIPLEFSTSLVAWLTEWAGGSPQCLYGLALRPGRHDHDQWVIGDVRGDSFVPIVTYEGGSGAIKWDERIDFESGSLVFEPVLENIKAYESAGATTDLVLALCDRMKIPARVDVKFPEQVVELPLPSWVTVVSDDWASSCSELLFRSDAAYFAEQFRKELGEWLAKPPNVKSA